MRLEIYIGKHCMNCEEAVRIGELARAIEGLDVVIIDVDQPGQYISPRVIAVPTYLLDGNIISLGNPAREEFLARLHLEVKEEIS